MLDLIPSTMPSLLLSHRHSSLRFRSFVGIFFFIISLFNSSLKAQTNPSVGTTADGPSSISGVILNRVTREPISRALVFTQDNQYATLTDDRGHFEFKFPPQQNQVQSSPQARATRDFRPNLFFVRKPGFLSPENLPNGFPISADKSEIILYLIPESLIARKVTFPGAEGAVRLGVELYRREFVGGREHWTQAGSFTSWAD